MKSISQPPLKRERGQSLMEFAISLMVLLLLLTGAVEISIALFQYVTIRDAAQEGATFGSIDPTNETEIEWRTMAAASDMLDLTPDDIAVTINGAACEGRDGAGNPNSITVEVTFPHVITFPFVAEILNSPTINLRATVTNTILQPACP